MKNIAFVSSSFENTKGIFPFVSLLEAHGYSVHWISFRKYEFRWLIKQGVKQHQILNTLDGLDSPMASDEIDARLSRLENGQEPYVNHIISMDRLLKLKNHSFARGYIAHIEKVVTIFLRQRGVTLVSGGRDTALQISTSKICKRLGISYIAPTMTRVPDYSFGFCNGYLEESFIYFRAPSLDDHAKAVDFLKNFRLNKPVPATVDFERRNNQFLKRIPRDIKLISFMAYRGIFDRSNDFTRYSMKKLFEMYWRRRWNSLCVRLAPPFKQQGIKPFVLYAYQMQPESSVDVLAAQYSDQITLIRQIARSVPSTHDFYVKPHPDHVGGLSRAKLKEISHIPGVTLVDPFVSGRELMHRASLIVTPAGTMSYEAALHGIPSIIFAKEFYSCLPSVHHCHSIDSLPTLVCKLLSEPPRSDDQTIIDYFAHLFANTFDGRYTNYFGALTESELKILLCAYDQLYEALCLKGESANSVVG